MICYIYNKVFRRLIAGVLALALAFPSSYLYAQAVVLPPAGDKVPLSQAFRPAVLSAVTVDAKDPLKFEFYVDPGQGAAGPGSEAEYLLLVKDFMTSLTIPEERLWVNLSPYEKDRIIDDRFGLTEMGRDLLAQDYMLKQITSSLIYPEEGIGKDFWAEVYRRAQDKFGTTDIPLDTFNKVWIMPDVADVYQKDTSAVVLKAHLKVMLETDYVTMEDNVVGADLVSARERADIKSAPTLDMTKQVMREIIIPILEKEVNEGKNFARLRQIYNALILATWYKKTMRETLLGRAYVDQSKVAGIEQADAAENQKIYDRYVDAFRKGVFNYVKEDLDRYSGEVIPRKYLSGGFVSTDLAETVQVYRGGKVNLGMNLFYRIGTSLKETFKSNPVQERVFKTYAGQIDDIKKSAYYIEKNRDNPKLQKEVKEREKLLKIKVKGMFRQLMEPEENKEVIVSAFDEIVDGKPSGLQSMILSGEHTLMVMKELLAISWFSQEDETKISYVDMLDMVGFDDDKLKPKLALIIEKIHELDDYKKLYTSLEELMLTLPDEKNILFLENVPLKNVLSDRRQEKGHYPGNPAAGITEEEWVEEVMAHQKESFKKGDAFLTRFLKSISKGVSNSAYVFLRSKARRSLVDKLSVPDVGPHQVFDLVAGRIAFPDLNSLIQAVLAIRKYVVAIDEFIRVHENKKAQLEKFKELNANKPGKEEELKTINKDLKKVNILLDNYRSEKFVLVALANPFNTKGGWPEWYKEAVHMVFMSGNGDESIEIQFKVMSLSILHDLEHVLKYKNNGGQESPVYKLLEKYMWVSKMIVMINYLNASGRREDVATVIDAFIKSLDDAQAIEKNLGGIDVRDVEGTLDVSGERSGFADVLQAGGEIFGLSPQILSVTRMDNLPFLEGAN